MKNVNKTKFKVFEYNQKWMAKFGIYPTRLNETVNEFLKSAVTHYFLIFAIPPVTILIST